MLYLIIEKFAEIFHIHFAFFCINYRCKTVKRDLFGINPLHGPNDITQLSDARGFYQNTIRSKLLQYLFHCFAKIPYQAAADTARVHFGYLNPRLLHKHTIHTDFAEFIFYQNQFLPMVDFLNQFFNQRCFTGTKKAGKNINLCHICLTSLVSLTNEYFFRLSL